MFFSFLPFLFRKFETIRRVKWCCGGMKYINKSRECTQKHKQQCEYWVSSLVRRGESDYRKRQVKSIFPLFAKSWIILLEDIKFSVGRKIPMKSTVWTNFWLHCRFYNKRFPNPILAKQANQRRNAKMCFGLELLIRILNFLQWAWKNSSNASHQWALILLLVG